MELPAGRQHPACARAVSPAVPIALWDAVEVRRLHCEVSLPDPALNGMLWGALATVDAASRTWLQCNFIGRNEVRTEVRLYPHRVVKTVLLFSCTFRIGHCSSSGPHPN